MTETPSEPGAARGRTRRILMTTAAVGAGHTSVAAALRERFAAASPELDIRCIDVLDFVPRAFRTVYAGGFALGMSRLRRLYGAGYWLSNRPHRPGRGPGERIRLRFERAMLRGYAAFVRRADPELILHTHFLPVPTTARLLDGGELGGEQMVVVTDVEVHRFWYARRVARWFVPAPPSAEPLRRWGVADDRVTVCGIPVRHRWADAHDETALRDEWNVPHDRPAVVLTGGATFTCGPIARVARRLLDACPHMRLFALAGRNERLYRRLCSLPEAQQRMTVLGFSPRLHELAAVSSLVITKPGGVTTSECLAAGKPMVLLPPVPGHEQGNAEFFRSAGAAVIARRPRDVAPLVAELLNDPARLEAMSAAARRLHRPAAETIVNAVRAATRPE
ncbi:MAG: MGDG synthase family glycosyltransferase [Planctomycetota bacterium]